MAKDLDRKDEKKPSIWDSTDVKIVHEGKQFVLPAHPEKMSYDEGIKMLERVKAAEEQKYDVHELVLGAPWDALTALAKAMQQIYGIVIATSIQTFFGEIKPELVTIQTGPNPEDSIQVASGQMQLPNITAPVRVGITAQGAYIVGTVKRKDRDALVQIAVLARQIMQTDSIYKGKAIHLHVDDDGELILHTQPDFIQLAHVAESDMIHTAKTGAMISTNIFGPLKHTAACRLHNIPLKRGILLEGKYGTGKSLTARVTAKVAIDNGWTFIMLDKSQGLASAIQFAKTYQPCVIFAEDIDRAGADRDNNEEVNDLVNLLDGMITKDMEMMVVMTTNFVDRIDRALLRPGRFDAIISIQTPDSETAIKLVRQYGRELVGASDEEMSMPSELADGKSLGELLNGQIPSMIREAVERAKLSMLMEDRDKLSAADLIVSAVGLNEHMALLADKKDEPTKEQVFYKAFSDMVRDSADLDTDAVASLQHVASDIGKGQRQLARTVTQKLEETQVMTQAAAGSAEKAAEKADAAKEIATRDLQTTKQVLRQVGG